MLSSKEEININIPLGHLDLPALLSIPEKSDAIIIFSHGSGSSRFSTRNQYVAQALQKRGYTTLLFDLLTEKEDNDRNYRFDIPLLTTRLKQVTEWVINNQDTQDMNIGYFGASTGAASALRAAALLDDKIKAVVSRGGRPDLATNLLHLVQAPTLLIVGSLDEYVIELNQEAINRMQCTAALKIIDGASHLFSEPGKLEKVAQMALQWFDKYLNKFKSRNDF